MTIEFEIIGEGLSSLKLLWNDINNNDINNNNNNNEISSINNRNNQLKKIYCVRNKMNTGSELDKCTSVNFHCNLLKNLIGLPHLPRIKELNLSSNNLGNEELTQLSLLPSLTSLDLSANKFTNFSILPFLSSLLKLSIAYNPIKSLEDISENVPNLEYLDIKGNNDISNNYNYLRSRRRFIVPLKGLVKIRELHITSKHSHDKINKNDDDEYAKDIYNLMQQIISLEIVDGMNVNDWKADANEDRNVFDNNKIFNPLPSIDIDSIATPRFDQVSSIFKSKLLNESIEKQESYSIDEENCIENENNNDNNNDINNNDEENEVNHFNVIDNNNNNLDKIIIDIENEPSIEIQDNDISAFSKSSSPMMKTNVIVVSKLQETNDKDNSIKMIDNHDYDSDQDVIIRVDRSTGQLVSRKRGSPMLLLLLLFKVSMNYENRQLIKSIRKWSSATKTSTKDYISIINTLTSNNNEILESLECEREKNRTNAIEWEKRLDVEKNKYSNASKKVLQQESILMSIRRDLEEKIRLHTEIEVNSIKEVGMYKDIILNKEVEIDILKKQLNDNQVLLDSCLRREEDLKVQIRGAIEKEASFQQKYDDWVSSRESLIQSVEQSQSALASALERETSLIANCDEYRKIINSFEEKNLTYDKTIISLNEKIASQETELSKSLTLLDTKSQELDEANKLKEKSIKRLFDTQKAFEESLAEVSSLSKTNTDLIKQKQIYCSTIDGLRICVKKMQESLKVKDKENIEKEIFMKQQYDNEKSKVLTTNIQSRLENLELGLVSRTEELFKAKEELKLMTENMKEKDLTLKVKETMLDDQSILIQELKGKLNIADKEIKQLQITLEELHGTVEEVRLDNIELETEIEAKSRVEKEMKMLLEELNDLRDSS